MTKAYEHMETTEKYGTPILEDKSVNKREEIGNKLFQLYKKSDYTSKEVANISGIPVWKIERIFAGDEDFSIYELTHIAGVLGYDFHLVFHKLG